MSYISFSYYILVIIALVAYYIFPERIRWVVLLIASAAFYYLISTSPMQMAVFFGSILISYCCGIQIEKEETTNNKKTMLVVGIAAAMLPLIVSRSPIHWVVPIGLSFYTLQTISYLVDIYKEDIKPQGNLFKYALFISFFPQIIQGPIPRYNQLGSQLFKGHRFDTLNIMKGIQLVIWGFFLKFMIADKAAVVVNAVLDDANTYRGAFLWVANILYCVQIYTDFLSCVVLSKGVAQMFGIIIPDNFNHPFFANSTKELWRRWHISLSLWLRDYIYFPLGGSKKGESRKYLNLAVTFIISGIWHGIGFTYLIWGFMQAFYQFVGDKLPKKLTAETNKVKHLVKVLITFFLFMMSVVFFRAESVGSAIRILKSMFSDFNPWILTDGTIYNIGLNQKEFEVLFLSIAVLFAVSFVQERGVVIRDWFNKQILFVRWVIYIAAICSIWIFGTYGFGFDAREFIYGGF